MALQHHFEWGNDKDAQLAGRDPIHGYQFFLYTYDQHPIQQPEESFTALKGISSHYQFAVNNEGLLYMHLRSCWCLSCIKHLMNGTLCWVGTSHKVPNCEALSSSNAITKATTNVYHCSHRRCEKTAGVGISTQIDITREDRNEAAHSLTVSNWALFDSDDEDVKLWLGRVKSNSEWGG